MTRETSTARMLRVLVFAPAGGLLGKSVADAAAGRDWWPWTVTAVAWLVVAGVAALAVRSRVGEPR